jgi:SAM-dependent methyltransferase
MKSEREAFFASAESLKTIDAQASLLCPEEPTLLTWHNSYVSTHRGRLALDLDIVKGQVGQNANILEFGSIPLLFTVALSRSNYKVTGCDIAPERYASTISKIGIDVVKCNIEVEKLPFQDNSFDAVVFNELFEHLRINPIFTLSEVFRIMKPKASLILSSPNLRSLNGIYNFLIRNKAHSCCGDIYTEYQKLEKLGHMGHVREYTTREVIEFLENIGFLVTKVIYRGQYNSFGKLIIRSLPSLSPYVSYIAYKPE